MAILLNGEKVEYANFPDGTKLMRLDYIDEEASEKPIIRWNYESDEEVWILWLVVNHIRERYFGGMILELSYVPNGRMDRVENREVHTLRHFGKFINILGFDRVYICDTHSRVTNAVLERSTDLQEEVLPKAFKIIENEIGDFQLFFPDKGACDRYKKFFKKGVLYGDKNRNWDTGELQGLPIIYNPSNMELDFEKPVLIVDDIMKYGDTCYYSILKLREMGFETFYIYVTHAERSVFDTEKSKVLDMPEVKGLYTIEGLMTEEDINHENNRRNKIRILKLFRTSNNPSAVCYDARVGRINGSAVGRSGYKLTTN